MTDQTFVVVLGGPVDKRPASPVAMPDDAVVIAADSGLRRANAMGLVVHHLVGDLDSLDASEVESAAEGGVRIHRHHPDKDATDAALAVDLARTLAGAGHQLLLVVGDTSGRLDHLLADLLWLGSPITDRFSSIEAWFGRTRCTVVRPGRATALAGRPHEQVSLLPLHGPASGITTSGLRWPLVDATLHPGTTRGISNEFTGEPADVVVGTGVVLTVQEGTLVDTPDDRAQPYDPTPR